MSQITLHNQHLRVVLDPDAGTSILAFDANVNGQWLPIMPDSRRNDVELNASNFLMAPYSNRIEDGRFVFQGQEIQLAHGDRHSIHGDVRTRAWDSEAVSETDMTLVFQSGGHENVNWPWPFEARARYSLHERAFRSELTLWNRGDATMPGGFGWHPYFSRSLTKEGEPVHLQFQTSGVYPDANSNRIPSGPLQAVQPEQDFTSEKPLDPALSLDNCFHGYDGNGHIRWPESNVQVTFSCSDACSHLILYNPAKPYFAVEPVTNANNGVNLLAGDDPTSGVVVLEPGESLRASFEMEIGD